MCVVPQYCTNVLDIGFCKNKTNDMIRLGVNLLTYISTFQGHTSLCCDKDFPLSLDLDHRGIVLLRLLLWPVWGLQVKIFHDLFFFLIFLHKYNVFVSWWLSTDFCHFAIFVSSSFDVKDGRRIRSRGPVRVIAQRQPDHSHVGRIFCRRHGALCHVSCRFGEGKKKKSVDLLFLFCFVYHQLIAEASGTKAAPCTPFSPSLQIMCVLFFPPSNDIFLGLLHCMTELTWKRKWYKIVSWCDLGDTRINCTVASSIAVFRWPWRLATHTPNNFPWIT